MRVQLIEDHERLAALVDKGLASCGFAVDIFAEGGDALAALGATHYDAVILDLGLPDMDGLELLRSLRAQGIKTPVLVLTSRIQVADRVTGLNAGADDYLTKPFAMEELIARLRALMRRPEAALGATLQCGNVAMDTVSREVRADDALLALSPRETSALEILLRRGGKVIPKTVIEDTLYGFGENMTANSVEVLVHRLRKKLEAGGADVVIHTVRGVGYMLIEAPA